MPNGGFDLALKVTPGCKQLRAGRNEAAEAPSQERKLLGEPEGSEQAELPTADLAEVALGE